MKPKPKTAWLIIIILLVTAIIVVVSLMVKFASEIKVDQTMRDLDRFGGVLKLGKSIGIISLREDSLHRIADRFPYLVAIVRNSTEWSFTCFGSLIIMQWVVTAAHCRKKNASHRVLLLYDFAQNFSQTYQISFWRLHEKYNASNPDPRYDIAIAKLNVDLNPRMKLAAFDDKQILQPVDAAIWKTVSTMDRRMYLTNDITKLNFPILKQDACYAAYGRVLDESTICVDMSKYRDCFVNEFGPIFMGHKVAGILSMKPKDCDLKIAIFTNVSYYATWILRSAHYDRILRRRSVVYADQPILKTDGSK